MSRSTPTTPSAGPTVRRVPEGDTHERLVCPDCGFVNYENPKIVVGSVAVWDGRVLLCRRAINPRRGFWTLPAGYMELHETSVDGAAREAWEEARARLAIRGLLAVYNIPRISQVQLIYLADLESSDIAAGPESTDVALFGWDEIPWREIAFPSVRWALDHWRGLDDIDSFAPRTNPPGDLGDMTV